jgi:site-specific DNA recombinase
VPASRARRSGTPGAANDVDNRAYARGEAPRSIAKVLNRESIPGPAGGRWGPSTIIGNARRGTGILNNELYVGRLVWNRLKYVKHPNTGKRQSRLNPPEIWIVKDVPELRIVPQELWEAVKARQADMMRATRPDRMQADFWIHQRPRYLLSGLMKCGVCGASYTKYGVNRLACAAARDRGTCTNHHTIRGDTVEGAILRGLKTRLMDPALFEEFAREFMAEVNKQRSAASAAKLGFAPPSNGLSSGSNVWSTRYSRGPTLDQSIPSSTSWKMRGND